MLEAADLPVRLAALRELEVDDAAEDLAQAWEADVDFCREVLEANLAAIARTRIAPLYADLLDLIGGLPLRVKVALWLVSWARRPWRRPPLRFGALLHASERADDLRAWAAP